MDGLISERRNLARTPICTITADGLNRARRQLGKRASHWLQASGFSPKPGHHALIPDTDFTLKCVLATVDENDPVWSLAALPGALPEGRYVLEDPARLKHPELSALGWTLGAYDFDRYRKRARAPATLMLPAATVKQVQPLADAVYLVRDLVNTPSQDMGPTQLAAQIKALAKRHNARIREWVGKDLLKGGYPTIHAVGRAATDAPRLVELTWGNKTDPGLTLVGKGVCFDSGGLDIKAAGGMRWMKKDMGGSAHVIALAQLVMQAKLPVRLTLLVPAVENAVAGNAFRPGEVITTRAGISVEIDNTDAEGRLVLCDALAHAVEAKPDLLIDFATLTGAARVALGPDLPAMFANRDDLAAATLKASQQTFDPVWRMPLWAPYRKMLDSYLADSLNSASSRHAGAITAALYLQQFVPDTTPWLHFDVYAWNDSDRPGRPRGGEAMALRAMFRMLQQRYGSQR